MNRRTLIKSSLAAAVTLALRPKIRALSAPVAGPEPYQPTWESLKQWRMPDWFRDAKFGIWAHWGPQCVPEQGDWYAREMYIQGTAKNLYHCKTYGHPSKFGFMEINHLWKAERWEPEKLLDLYVKTGAKYFMALAAHHDNLDCFASTHHSWNTTRVGPRKDIVGTWEKLARERGLRFGVSNHASHAWHWFQTAYGYDAEGPLAGVRYDAATLKVADGRGKWWDGLDPQELYTGPNMVMPDGMKTIADVQKWHQDHDRKWTEAPPAMNPEFTRKWFLRCRELVDKYQPDLLYFDDTELPLGQAGLDIVAHYYNASLRWNGGVQQAVVAAKKYSKAHLGATMLDIERGRSDEILAQPWQTDTCIGSWHYSRPLYEKNGYKTPLSVAQALVDIVSKNGNLMLNIPLRGDGTIDDREQAFLDDFGQWMRLHGEAIYGTRPYKVSGEGLTEAHAAGGFNERGRRPYTGEDLRFTCKGDRLFVFALDWPDQGAVHCRTLALGSRWEPRPIAGVRMLGLEGRLRFRQDASGLHIELPPKPGRAVSVCAFELMRA